jgi:hypothetical protein
MLENKVNDLINKIESFNRDLKIPVEYLEVLLFFFFVLYNNNYIYFNKNKHKYS